MQHQRNEDLDEDGGVLLIEMAAGQSRDLATAALGLADESIDLLGDELADFQRSVHQGKPAWLHLGDAIGFAESTLRTLRAVQRLEHAQEGWSGWMA